MSPSPYYHCKKNIRHCRQTSQKFKGPVSRDFIHFKFCRNFAETLSILGPSIVCPAFTIPTFNIRTDIHTGKIFTHDIDSYKWKIEEKNIRFFLKLGRTGAVRWSQLSWNFTGRARWPGWRSFIGTGHSNILCHEIELPRIYINFSLRQPLLIYS